jgi:hypothetical protein
MYGPMLDPLGTAGKRQQLSKTFFSRAVGTIYLEMTSNHPTDICLGSGQSLYEDCGDQFPFDENDITEPNILLLAENRKVGIRMGSNSPGGERPRRRQVLGMLSQGAAFSLAVLLTDCFRSVGLSFIRRHDAR